MKSEAVFQLFVEKLSGCISPEDEALLDEMLVSDAALREAWLSLEGEARRLDLADFLGRISADVDLDSLKARMQPQREGAQPLRGSMQPQRGGEMLKKKVHYKKIFSIAAIFLLVLASGAWFIFFKKPVLVNREQIIAAVRRNQPSVSLRLSNGRSVDLDNAGDGHPIAVGKTTLNPGKGALNYVSEDTSTNMLSVPAGGRYRIALSDGTEVLLNAATRLRFPFRFGTGTREVYLEGEAYFKVAADVRRPFVVHTSLTRVEVLGTSFNINSYEEGRVMTALVEGRVVTKAGDGSAVELTPGHAAEYRASKGFSSSVFDEDEELSWINGVYYFHDMPMASLASLASRCYGVNIVIDKEKLAGRSVTGLLDRDRLSDFLNDLETTAHVKYHYSGNSLYLE